jgi:hypothetical protein
LISTSLHCEAYAFGGSLALSALCMLGGSDGAALALLLILLQAGTVALSGTILALWRKETRRMRPKTYRPYIIAGFSQSAIVQIGYGTHILIFGQYGGPIPSAPLAIIVTVVFAAITAVVMHAKLTSIQDLNVVNDAVSVQLPGESTEASTQ